MTSFRSINGINGRRTSIVSYIALSVIGLLHFSTAGFGDDKRLSSRDLAGIPRADYLAYINGNDEGGVAGINCDDCQNDDVNSCPSGCIECNIDGAFCDCAEEALPTGGPCSATSDCSPGLICCTNCGTSGLCVIPCGQACFDTTDCDDGNACTVDICQNNLTCAHENVVCDDMSPCTNDFCDTVIGCQFPLIPCDDMDDCTLNGCDENTGACVFTNNCCTSDDDCDDNNGCANDHCNVATGFCVFNDPPCQGCVDSSDCVDGSNCTQDLCTGGFCENPLTCVPIDPTCLVAACENDVCVVNPRDCNDNDDCTMDSCEEAGGVGCVNTPLPDCSCVTSDDCNDNDECTTDTCDADMCTHIDNCAAACGSASGSCCEAHNDTPGCNDTACCESVCSLDGFCCELEWDDMCVGEALGDPNCSCDVEGCGNSSNDCCSSNGTPFCSDATCCECVCSIDSFCCDIEWDAYCAEEAACECAPACGNECDVSALECCEDADCDDGSGCTIDSCVFSAGSTFHTCTNEPVGGGTAGVGECDGNLCTVDDVCMDGSCIPGTPVSCMSDSEPCTMEACNPMTGLCESTPLTGEPCSDSNACTDNDTCIGGSCVPGPATDCDDGIDCTTDSCDPMLGCQNIGDNAECDDDNPCTEDICCGGDNDGSLECAKTSGCINPPIGGTSGGAIECDGNLCTLDDSCSDGVCIPGTTMMTCPDDGNPCTDETCDPMTGLCSSVNDNSNTCTDNNACTLVDSCVDGACVGSVPDACDDGVACTVDSCTALAGCVHTPNNALCDDGDACTTDICTPTGCTNPCTDTIDPVPTGGCPPAMIEVECDQPVPPFDPAFTDNCDPMLQFEAISTIGTGDCPQEGSISRSKTAIDNCGNSASCGQVVTIVDTTAPVVGNCPEEVTYECSDPFPGFNPTFTDNCDTMLVPTGDCVVVAGTCLQENTTTCSQGVEDDCGNLAGCTTVFHKVDTTPPVVTCEPIIVVRCNSDAGIPVGDVWVPDGQAVDNCDESVPVSDNRPTEGMYPVSCDEPGTFITFTAMDDCGNIGTCVTEVRVTGGLCCPTAADTDLKLLVTDLDLRQDTEGPTTTKARFDVWNQNEVRFSGTERCITCWDETLISQYLAPHLVLQNLQTDKGKARIQNEASTICPDSSDSPLLGVAIREYQFLGDPAVSMRSAVTLVGMGEQVARIQYDPPSDTEEAFGGDSGFTISDIANGSVNVVDNPRAPSFNPGSVAGGGVSPNRASTTAKGSLIIWPVIEVKWDANGTLIQDTFIQILNDFPADVDVQFYMVNGDAPLDPVFEEDSDILIERAHPGWNNSDFKIRLTDDEPTYWSVATGQPKGVSPFSVLDAGNPNGRPDLDPSNPGGRVIRGFLLAWAVNVDGEEIRWNHLKGHAIGVRYDQGTAFDYNPWSFAVVSGVPQGAESDANSGNLNLDGIEYDFAPETLLFDFFAAGSQAMSHPDVRP